jgi:hypothetical protein
MAMLFFAEEDRITRMLLFLIFLNIPYFWKFCAIFPKKSLFSSISDDCRRKCCRRTSSLHGFSNRWYDRQDSAARSMSSSCMMPTPQGSQK